MIVLLNNENNKCDAFIIYGIESIDDTVGIHKYAAIINGATVYTRQLRSRQQHYS